jgi:hypothetical protein
MHRLLVLLVSLAALCTAQSKLPTSTLENLKPVDLGLFKPIHIHYSSRNCKNEPDKVYSKTNGIYFACVNRQEVCNRSPHSIPKHLIDTFEREIRELKEHVDRSLRESRQRNEAARAKDEAEWGPRRAAAARMRESRMAGRAGGRTVPVAPALSPAAQVVKVPDERVQEIVTGTTREELIRKFGPPHSRISGDSERVTYLLSSGASLRVDIEADAVTNVRVIPQQ